MKLKCDSVNDMYLAGKPQVANVKALKHLNMSKSFISCHSDNCQLLVVK